MTDKNLVKMINIWLQRLKLGDNDKNLVIMIKFGDK